MELCLYGPWFRSEGRVPSSFLGIRDFPHLKLGIRDLKAKSGRVSGFKVWLGGGMPKIPLGITRLHEIWVGITGLKNTFRYREEGVHASSRRSLLDEV